MSQGEGSQLPGMITQREREILQLMSDGLTNEAIGRQLFLSTETVKWYAKQIYSKLAVNNRTEAAKLARELGLFEVQPPATMVGDTTPRHHLPTQLSPLIGRARDVTFVMDLLGRPDCHLVTLTGPGGIGKTTLAVEVGNRCRTAFPDGVYFVALQPMAASGFLEFAIANAAGLLFSGTEAPKVQLLEFLRTKELLLILDNFEHLLQQAALVHSIRNAASKVKLLVTSRESLRLRDEWLITLEGLPVTTEAEMTSAEAGDALQLFEERAKRVDQRFSLAQEQSSVTRICQLVQGIPLGIEIAASWVSSLPCEEIATQIQQGLDFLSTDMRDIPERHRSMRAVFEQSWRLLPEHEQAVLQRLAVFRSGFAKEAAADVADASLSLLASFVHKSLIWRLPGGRYAVHELLRQYLQEKLSEAPDEHEAVNDRYAGYYANFMAEQWPRLKNGRAKAALDAIDLEIENIWVAWQYWVDKKDGFGLHKMINPLAHFYGLRKADPEIQAFFELALDALGSPVGEAAFMIGCLLHRLAFFSMRAGNWERGKAQSQEAIAILKREDSPEDLMLAFEILAIIYFNLKEYQAAQVALESQLAVAEVSNNRWGIAWALVVLGQIAMYQGLDRAAAKFGLESLSLMEEVGDRYGIGVVNSVLLGRIAQAQSLYAEAKERYLHALTLFEEIGAQLAVAVTLRHLGMIATASGNYEEANLRFLHSLEFFHRMGLGRGRQVTGTFIYVGELFAAEGQTEPGIEVLAFVIAHTGSTLTRSEAETALTQLRSRVPEPQFSMAEQRGQLRTLDEIMTHVLGQLRH